MIDLRECSISVKNEKEYYAVAEIAKLQGFHWATGESLEHVYCTFPCKLYFKDDYCTYYGSTLNSSLDRHYTYNSLISGLRDLITRRKSIC